MIKLFLGFGVMMLVMASGVFAQTQSPAFPPPGAASATEMPLLRGDLWQKMTLNEKVAFVWGVGALGGYLLGPQINR